MDSNPDSDRTAWQNLSFTPCVNCNLNPHLLSCERFFTRLHTCREWKREIRFSDFLPAKGNGMRRECNPSETYTFFAVSLVTRYSSINRRRFYWSECVINQTGLHCWAECQVRSLLPAACFLLMLPVYERDVRWSLLTSSRLLTETFIHTTYFASTVREIQ